MRKPISFVPLRHGVDEHVVEPDCREQRGTVGRDSVAEVSLGYRVDRFAMRAVASVTSAAKR